MQYLKRDQSGCDTLLLLLLLSNFWLHEKFMKALIEELHILSIHISRVFHEAKSYSVVEVVAVYHNPIELLITWRSALPDSRI